MNESESKWSPRRKLVVLVLAAAVGIAAWVLSTALAGPDPSCRGAKCVSDGVELGPDQWSLIDQQDDSVTIRFDEGGGCHHFKKAQVNESEVDVKVTLVVEYFVPGEGEACTDQLKRRSVDVRLNDDLGEKQLRVFTRGIRVSR